MDCNCNCFGFAASSKRPVKRYNLLVPDIFPAKPPAFSDRVDSSTERKIKKLYEYLEKNLHRGPKASRRLARRINKELAARRYGYVQVAVAAYIYLLEHLRDNDSALFAREVICQRVARPTHFYHRVVPANGCANAPLVREASGSLGLATVRAPGSGEHNHSVADTLLGHSTAEVRSLGARLLSEFIKQQNGTEYLQIIEAFVPMLVENIEEHDTLAGLPGRDPSATREGLQIACLRALKEEIRLHARTSKFSAHLETVETCLLDLINSSTPPSPANAAHLARHEELRRDSTASTSTTRSLGPGNARSSVPATAESRDSVAVEVFEELGRLAQDPAEMMKIVDILLRYEDRHESWPTGPGQKTSRGFDLLREVCGDEHQRYLLFTALIRHVTAVAPALQLAVLQTACQQAAAFPPSLASPALVLAVKELAPVLSGSGTAAGAELREAVLVCIRRLAERLEDQEHPLEALGGVVGKLPGPSPISSAVLECLLAAVQAAPHFPPKEGKRHAPPFRQTLLQELMAILVQWEAQQRLLAHAILQAVLPALGGHLRPQHILALLSAVWYEVALETSPQLFVALSASLAAIVHQSPSSALREVASLTLALQWEALSSSPARLSGQDAPMRCLSVLLLCAWSWALLAERLQAPRLRELQPDIHKAPGLRLAEGGLELDEVAESVTADETSSAASTLPRLREQAGTQQAQLDALAAVFKVLKGSSTVGEGVQLFEPLPVSSLQPRVRVGSSWFGGSLSAGSRAPTSDFAAQRMPGLAEANSGALDSPVARGIHTVHDLLAAAEAERAALPAPESTSRQSGQMSPIALSALAAVDAILGEHGMQDAAGEEPPAASQQVPKAQAGETQGGDVPQAKTGTLSHEMERAAEDGADCVQHHANGNGNTASAPGKVATMGLRGELMQNGEVRAI